MSDPGATSQPQLLEAGLENLKRKFSFLSEYSDEFINATGVNVLIKAETASRKLQKLDKERKAESHAAPRRITDYYTLRKNFLAVDQVVVPAAAVLIAKAQIRRRDGASVIYSGF